MRGRVDSIGLYSADATRFALAEAGDSLEDANFDRTVSNAAGAPPCARADRLEAPPMPCPARAVLKLTNEEDWWTEMIEAMGKPGVLRSADSPLNFHDRAFRGNVAAVVAGTRGVGAIHALRVCVFVCMYVCVRDGGRAACSGGQRLRAHGVP